MDLEPFQFPSLIALSLYCTRLTEHLYIVMFVKTPYLLDGISLKEKIAYFNLLFFHPRHISFYLSPHVLLIQFLYLFI